MTADEARKITEEAQAQEVVEFSEALEDILKEIYALIEIAARNKKSSLRLTSDDQVTRKLLNWTFGMPCTKMGERVMASLVKDNYTVGKDGHGIIIRWPKTTR